MSRALTNKPIPGQSLTRPPETPMPMERPPKYAEMNQAVGAIFDDLTSDKKLEATIRVFKKNAIFVDTLTGAYLEKGMIDGKWTADMVHLLVEPVMFIFMWIAAEAGLPVKFRRHAHRDSSGLDILQTQTASASERAARSLLEVGE